VLRVAASCDNGNHRKRRIDMPQKGRTPPTPTKILGSQIATEQPSEAAWSTAERLRTLDAHTVAAGVAQHSSSGLWHTWVSLYGADLTSWYVGPEFPVAYGVLAAVEKLFSAWGGTEDEEGSIEALLETAKEYSTAPNETLPDGQALEILAEIAARQQRKN
jgi:hypothetical protein